MLRGIVIAVSALMLGAVGVRTTHAASEGQSNPGPQSAPQAPAQGSTGMGACCGSGGSGS